MKIVIDKAIPFINGVLEPFADVVYEDGEAICPQTVRDADALIIRTRTRCDAFLLEGSSVKLIATATIGMDHIDIPYCDGKGIFYKNASGCNSGGVMNYVFSALYGVAARKSIPLSGATIGIIGVGSVGKRVQQAALSLGFKVLLCDPPREMKEGSSQFCSMDYLLQNSDIVTLHTPLNAQTRGMANAEFFSKMRLGSFFINAARGEIVVEKDLIEASPKLGAVIIDTWNNEPDINRKLLNVTDLATPHIAGYSYQGKQWGTAYAVRAVARFFSIESLLEFFPASPNPDMNAVKVDLRDKPQGHITSIIQYNYPIFTDDFMFRMNPSAFERLRKEYKYRREFFID